MILANIIILKLRNYNNLENFETETSKKAK